MTDTKIETLRAAYDAAEAAYTTARTDHADAAAEAAYTTARTDDAYRDAYRAANAAQRVANAAQRVAYAAAAAAASAAYDAWIAYQAALKAEKDGQP